MGILDGKKAVIFGVANDHSIAWGIAQALRREGAELAFSYAGESLERRVRPLAEQVNASFVEECDVTSDEAIERVFAKLADSFGTFDILVHAVAYARREDLTGRFLNTSRAGWATAMDISVYSLVALTRAALPHFNPGATVLTLSYYGAEKVIPNYNVMGVAKSALEATVRYLAADLGPDGFRVNAISAGPIRTLSASGIGNFRKLHKTFAEAAPLRRNVTIEDVGNSALWLCSDLSSGVTGEVVYVDAGYNILGMSEGDKEGA
jgi:enoyl-[acyl-carrier protein] reductase I